MKISFRPLEVPSLSSQRRVPKRNPKPKMQTHLKPISAILNGGYGFSVHALGGTGKGALPAILSDGIIYRMKLRLDKSKCVIPPKTSAKTAKAEQPAMIQVDGLWIHQGAAEPGANWERVLNDVREERIQTVLKS